MTDRELKRLSRRDLLELLLEQSRERDALRLELEKTKAALAERKLCIEQAGSIAEAALRLNGVFEAAQAAAEQYLESIRQPGMENGKDETKILTGTADASRESGSGAEQQTAPSVPGGLA